MTVMRGVTLVTVRRANPDDMSSNTTIHCGVCTMFDRKAWILARLGSMELGELDSLSGLQMRGTDGWEEVAGPIKSTLVDAYTNDGVNRDDLPATLGSFVEGLVPTVDREVMRELTVIASAWDLPNDPDDGFDAQPKDSLTAVVQAALGKAYEDGMIAVAEAIESEADEADDPDDDPQD